MQTYIDFTQHPFFQIDSHSFEREADYCLFFAVIA